MWSEIILFFIEDGPRNTKIFINNIPNVLETIEERKTITVPLYCSSNCNPPCTTTWYKYGTLLSGETNEVFNMPRNRTMSGVYTCRATGEEGSETSKPVTVTVTCKLQCFLYTCIQINKKLTFLQCNVSCNRLYISLQK